MNDFFDKDWNKMLREAERKESLMKVRKRWELLIRKKLKMMSDEDYEKYGSLIEAMWSAKVKEDVRRLKK